MTTKMPRKVRIETHDGEGVYNGLMDDGGPILRFASGYGFVERDYVRRNHLLIVDRWRHADESEAA